MATSGCSASAIAEKLRGVGGLTDDVHTGVAEQACEPLAEQRRVVGDHDSHGISARSRVPAPGALVDEQATVERADPVDEAAKSGAAVETSSADAVVLDLDRHAPGTAHDGDLSPSGTCVLRDVRERLGDDEVHGRLDVRRKALRRARSPHGNRRALGQRSYSGVEALVGEYRGVDAASELAKLAQCALCLRLCLVHEGCRLLVSVHSRP